MLSSFSCPSARSMAKALTVPSLSSPDPVGLVGGIQAGSGGVQRQATRARAHLVDAGGRHRPGGAIHLEEVDAAAIAGRQVHLRRQHVAERGAEGADIGQQRRGASAGSPDPRNG